MHAGSGLPSVLRRRIWRLMGAFCVTLGPLLLLSCQSSRGVKQAPTQVPSEDSLDSEERWIFHPTSRGTVLDSVEVGGGLLEVDSQGSRWLRVGAQPPEVSAYGAPEGLVGVALEDKKILAIGESGTVYIAEDPLGRFVSERAPPEPWVRTQKTGKLLTSVSRSGHICRSSDWGRTWSQEVSPEFFVDLQATLEGGLVALSVPEQWHFAQDPTQAWRVLSASPMAPQGMVLDRKGELRVWGALSDYVFDPSSANFTSLPPEKQKRKASTFALPRFARASPVAQGRATLRGGRFTHLRSPKLPDRAHWQIESGEIDEVLSARRVSGIEGCASYLFTANQSHAALVCQSRGARSSEMSPLVRIFRSRDQGRTFSRIEGKFRGKASELAIDLSSDGQLAIGGLCPEEESEAACRPRGVVLLGLHERRHLHLVGVRRAEAVGFGAGNALWVLGSREKDRHALLFGPIGSSASTSIPALDLTREAGLTEQASKADSNEEARSSGANCRSRALQLFPGTDAVSVAMSVTDGTVLATVDQAGQLLTSSLVPGARLVVGGAGSSLMALSTRDDRLLVSESGGAAWSLAELPRPVCGGDPSCDVPLVCSTSGCLLGDELSRLGFGGPPGKDPQAESLDADRESTSAAAGGYKCQLGSEAWTDLPGLVAVPGASDAALGEAAWVGVMLKSEQANAVSVAASLDGGQISERSLLPQVSLPESYLVSLRPQIEGSAVVRFPRPSPVQSGATRVEVGWDNRVLGLVGGGNLTATLSGRSSSRWPLGPPQSAGPSFVSIAGRGVYLRMESQGEASQTYFIAGTHQQHTVDSVHQVRWPASGEGGAGWFESGDWGGRSREERMQLGGRDVSLLLVGSGHALFQPRDQGGFSTYLLGALHHAVEGVAHRVGIAYRGNEPGFVSMHLVSDSTHSRAEWVKPTSEGSYEPPLSVPLQSDLGASIVPCSAEQRSTTPRIVAPLHEQEPRKLEVVGLPFALELASDDAVLFGTPQSPCVAAWASETVRPEVANSSEQYDVLVIPGDSKKSWLFRRSQHGEAGTLASARPLTCLPLAAK